MTRLVAGSGHTGRAQQYRRVIGWLIVAMSYAMAGFALLEVFHVDVSTVEDDLPILGGAMAAAVILVAFLAVLRRGKRKSQPTHEI